MNVVSLALYTCTTSYEIKYEFVLSAARFVISLSFGFALVSKLSVFSKTGTKKTTCAVYAAPLLDRHPKGTEKRVLSLLVLLQRGGATKYFIAKCRPVKQRAHPGCSPCVEVLASGLHPLAASFGSGIISNPRIA